MLLFGQIETSREMITSRWHSVDLVCLNMVTTFRVVNGFILNIIADLNY